MRYSAKRIFFPCPEVFVCSTVNAFVLYLKGGLENPRKRAETRGIIFYEAQFNLRIDRAERRTETRQRTQEKYRTSALHF